MPRVAVDVSVTDPDLAARFDAVLARDHDGEAKPDISLVVQPPRLPVVGVINTHAQPAYGEDCAETAAAVVVEALRGYPAAVIDLDTRVDPRLSPLERDPRSCAELESLLTRLDALVTSRLHGLVLGLRNGVPTVAIDVIPAGGKVAAQADVLSWPHLIRVEDLTVDAVRAMLDRCLKPAARDHAAAAVAAAAEPLADLRRRFQRTVAAYQPSRSHH